MFTPLTHDPTHLNSINTRITHNLLHPLDPHPNIKHLYPTTQLPILDMHLHTILQDPLHNTRSILARIGFQ